MWKIDPKDKHIKHIQKLTGSYNRVYVELICNAEHVELLYGTWEGG
jgi:hypothetical protein